MIPKSLKHYFSRKFIHFFKKWGKLWWLTTLTQSSLFYLRYTVYSVCWPHGFHWICLQISYSLYIVHDNISSTNYSYQSQSNPFTKPRKIMLRIFFSFLVSNMILYTEYEPIYALPYFICKTFLFFAREHQGPRSIAIINTLESCKEENNWMRLWKKRPWHRIQENSLCWWFSGFCLNSGTQLPDILT